MRKTLIAAAVLAAFSLPAQAQLYPRTTRVACAAGEVLPRLLTRDYGEAPAEQGVANGALVQLWHNVETGSWTLLLIAPDGTACALASGEDWMKRDAPKGEET